MGHLQKVEWSSQCYLLKSLTHFEYGYPPRPFNQLDSPVFAWHTKNSLLGGLKIPKPGLCVKQKGPQDMGWFLNPSRGGPGKKLSQWDSNSVKTI
jgi:hypothetical protein